MSTYTTGFDKKYKCSKCNKFYGKGDILEIKEWKCPECGEYLHIAAPELGTGRTLVRKRACELNIYDQIHLPGYEYIYEVLNITKKKGKIDLALKGYGKLSLGSDEFVSIIVGGYYAKSWED